LNFKEVFPFELTESQELRYNDSICLKDFEVNTEKEDYEITDLANDFMKVFKINEKFTFLFETSSFFADSLHFGFYFPKSQNSLFSIEIREIQKNSLYPDQELQQKFEEAVFDEDAAQISQDERCKDYALLKQISFTYGEVELPYFKQLLKFLEPFHTFWDLGCGAGKPLFYTSVLFPQL